MSPYPGNPNEYDFGTQFNYAVWTPATTLDLVNVPWNNDYRDIVKFDNRAALDAYINGLTPDRYQLTEATYHKPNTPIRVPIPFNVAYKYNYIRATNPAQPIPGDIARSYYYFIAEVRYINPSVSELVLQLDVWQTFGYDITFGNSYVERGHIGIANENAFANYGRDYLTTPEGLDVGSGYVHVERAVMPVLGGRPSPEWDINILVYSTVDLSSSGGTKESPVIESAEGTFIQGTLASGAAAYLFRDPLSFTSWLAYMKDKPWVTQGIISAMAVPAVKRYGVNVTFPGAPIEPVPFPESWFTYKNIHYNMMENWRDAESVSDYIGERYSHLRKFWTSPYMAIELTTYNGQPIVLKPEYWNNDDAMIIERPSYLPPGQKITFSPFKYNSVRPEVYRPSDGTPLTTINENTFIGDDMGDYVDTFTQIGNFPTLPVVNDGALLYLASNANGLAYQREAADWAQQRALQGAQAAYDNANTGIDLNKLQNLIGQSQAYQQNANSNNALLGNAAISLGTGIIGGGAGGPGGGVGAITGQLANGLGALINQGSMNTSHTINMNAANQNLNAQQFAGEAVRDTNKGLADWAARGDYANQIAGINAKVQDAQMIPPSVAGQAGGEAHGIIHGYANLHMRIKMIDKSAIRAIGEFWLRYGYTINSFIRVPASLMVMSKFTYWKLTETYITAGNMPEPFKQAIRGIFEKGVTVWKNPTDIGVIDLADNEPLDGVSY